MTEIQRRLLERFSGGDRPLNAAIRAALFDLDRLSAATRNRPGTCPACAGYGHIATRVGPVTCEGCQGTGRIAP
ncbi:MAG: hypothetical protein KGR26_09615 [Cyanobacteria bacterium REEB65]|nr:hypothetical protein [Cyanobacteria bacterium REEB65]